MAVSSSNAVVVIADAGDVDRALQCDLSGITYARTRATSTKATFCAVEKSVGNMDISFSGDGQWNDDANRIDEVLDGLIRDSVPHLYKYGPNGSGTGEVMYSGVALLVNYTITEAAEGVVEINYEFEGNGNDVRTTW